MKRNCSILFILMFALFFTALSVQAAETLKIGIVDLQRVIAESKTVDNYRKKLGKDVEAKNSLLSDKQNAAAQIEEKLKKDGSKLQTGERNSLEEKLRREMKDLKRMKEDMEHDLKKADRELTEKSLKGINMIVEQIYEKENFSIIFEKNAAGVVKFKNALDITDKVIKAYDAK